MSSPPASPATPPMSSPALATTCWSCRSCPGPGGIGRVRATGPDATRLKVGDWVYCDPTVRSRDDAANPDMILQGWTYRSEAGLPLHRYFHHGSFAEQMLVPTENVTPIGDIERGGRGPVDSHRPAARAVRRAAGG